MKKLSIDAVGDQCPLPVIKAKKALEGLEGPGVVEVRVNDAVAVENLKRLAASQGLGLEVRDLGGGVQEVGIRAEAPLPRSGPELPDTSCPAPTAAVTAAIGSRTMGQGDDELGAVLMKGFIYALTQLEQAPQTLLFYNGGAWLTTEDSPLLEDLKSLEQQGVEILTCGTCLNHYGRQDRLAMGQVTNMYAIVEKLMASARVIKP